MIFIDACFKRPIPYTPIWLMRQAGRYLSEYRAVRAGAGDFLALCKNYRLASEVSLQPVEILGVDAAIIFSDILVVPLEMGMELRFTPGEGPVFPSPISTEEEVKNLAGPEAVSRLNYVFDALSLTRDKLPPDKALIGFCGSPWTLATYMIEGQGSKSFARIKRLAYESPELLHALLARLTEVLKHFLAGQIRAGADALQIFDSWAGALEGSAFFEFSYAYLLELCAFIKAAHPEVPLIIFPKGIPGQLGQIAELAQRGVVGSDFEVLGLGWEVPLAQARRILSPHYVLQGNLEPCRLYSREATRAGVEQILEAMRGAAHIFNLGHGMLPDLPVENAKYLIRLVRELSAR